MTRQALIAGTIFDGTEWHSGSALLVEGDAVTGIVPAGDVPAGTSRIDAGALLAPGFVDLQVNGGGGIMFNDAPEVDAIARVCRTHARLGTTALMATVVTDRPDVSRRMVDAGSEAAQRAVPGFLGVHLEGPHLSVARKGAHDASLIRPLDAEALAFLINARGKLPHLLVTLAPESASAASVLALAKAGVIVSLGHSDAAYDTATEYAAAGATLATHLFNAMSQLESRRPGIVGAVLSDGGLSAGLIADGVHVHPVTIATALRAKRAPGRLFLVSDAVATAGSDITSFNMAGRRVTRANGRLTLEDGTLAGADTTMAASLRFLHRVVGVDLGEALRMASVYPADAIGALRHGRLTPGARADAVALTTELEVTAAWIGGLAV
jgi:N-acetylglucosamine-6-phosphate deacetylase